MLYNKTSVRYLLDIMFLRKVLWLLRFKKYDKLRKENSKPTKEQWISWNSDNLGCPKTKVYNKDEVYELMKPLKIYKTWTTNYGWFRKIVACK
jgi:hypothetical protein